MRYERLMLLVLVLVVLGGCRSTPKERLVSGPVRVSPTDVDASEPAIAVAPDGDVYVIWGNHGANRQADVMVARLGGDGAIRGPAVRVNSQPGMATAWRGDPPTIAVAPDNTVFIGWTARLDSDSAHTTDIYVSVSRDQGRTFSEPVKVNDDKKPAVHGMHSIAIGKDGRIYVAWLDERNISPLPATDMKMSQGTRGRHMESNREVFISSSSDGGRTFTANKRVATNVCPCCKTALTVAQDGRVYLSWRQVLPGDFRHIAVASPTDQGQTFTEPKIVSDDQWMIAGCPVSGSSMAVAADGTLHVLWYSAGKNGEAGLYSSESKDGGKTFGARTLVSKGETRGTPVLLNSASGLMAVWQADGNKIMTASLTQKSRDALAISTGELPAAAAMSTDLIAAYIAKADQHQAVWIVLAKSPNQ